MLGLCQCHGRRFAFQNIDVLPHRQTTNIILFSEQPIQILDQILCWYKKWMGHIIILLNIHAKSITYRFRFIFSMAYQYSWVIQCQKSRGGCIPFPRLLTQKVNKIARLEFELVYFVEILHVSHETTKPYP